MRCHRTIAPSAALLLAFVATVAGFGDQKKSRPEPAEPARPESRREIALHFRGRIDGSERIEVTQTHAYWHHLHWALPKQAAILNDVEWNPREDRSLANAGATRFLAENVDFQSARLEVIKGRDTVVLERKQNSVVIHINDTPNGGALYEFGVLLKPACRRATLQIVARIDGSGQLHVDAAGARWVHRHWQRPREIRMNQVNWRLDKSPELKNEGETRFLDGPVDFSSAKLTVNHARDTAVLEPAENGLIVHFADNPLGGDVYDLTISFGQ